MKRKEEPSKTSKAIDAPKSDQEKNAKPLIVLIQAAAGKRFADVLGKLRKEVDPDVSSTPVVGARLTKQGDLLIRIGSFSFKIF